jgi:MFS family permease
MLAGALTLLLNVAVVGHRDGFASARALGLTAAGLALAAAFIGWEIRSRAPLLPIGLFRHRPFAAASVVAFAYGIGLFGTTYLVPVFAQDIAHYDAAMAGYLLAPPGIALAVAIAAGGRLTDRLQPAPIVIAGLALFALSSLLLAFSGAATGFVLLALWLVVGRAGLGMLIPALNVGAVQSLTGSELAYASAAVNFVRQLGGAIGVNLLAVVLEWRSAMVGPGDPARPFHECFAIVTLAFALAIIPAWSIRSR